MRFILLSLHLPFPHETPPKRLYSPFPIKLLLSGAQQCPDLWFTPWAWIPNLSTVPATREKSTLSQPQPGHHLLSGGWFIVFTGWGLIYFKLEPTAIMFVSLCTYARWELWYAPSSGWYPPYSENLAWWLEWAAFYRGWVIVVIVFIVKPSLRFFVYIEVILI